MSPNTIAALAAFEALALAVESKDLPASIAARKALGRCGFVVAYQKPPAVRAGGDADATIADVNHALRARRGAGR